MVARAPPVRLVWLVVKPLMLGGIGSATAFGGEGRDPFFGDLISDQRCAAAGVGRQGYSTSWYEGRDLFRGRVCVIKVLRAFINTAFLVAS